MRVSYNAGLKPRLDEGVLLPVDGLARERVESAAASAPRAPHRLLYSHFEVLRTRTQFFFFSEWDTIDTGLVGNSPRAFAGRASRYVARLATS